MKKAKYPTKKLIQSGFAAIDEAVWNYLCAAELTAVVNGHLQQLVKTCLYQLLGVTVEGTSNNRPLLAFSEASSIPRLVKPRVEKVLAKLERDVTHFTLTQEEIQDLKDNIRDRFRRSVEDALFDHMSAEVEKYAASLVEAEMGEIRQVAAEEVAKRLTKKRAEGNNENGCAR